MDEPLRVLIAEDETIIRLDLRGLLERHGMRVCGEALRSPSGSKWPQLRLERRGDGSLDVKPLESERQPGT
jgi:DNA-binding NarL/FixJ family response regulator